MRKRGTAKFRDLVSTGQTVLNITPSSGAESAMWETGGVKVRTMDGRYNYIRRFWNNTQFTFTQAGGAGAVVNWDKLGKAIQSAELVSQDLGTIYSHKNTRGAVLQHLIGPVACGGNYQQPARIQIAAANGNYTVQLLTCVPLSHESLLLPDETSQSAAFFQAGTLEFLLAPSNIFVGDSPGSSYSSAQLRCVAEYYSAPDQMLGFPMQWQDREIPGGGDSPILRMVGQQSGWNGLRIGCGIGGMWWLTDATGIGLNGADGTDNISQIQVQALNQEAVKNLDGFYHTLRLSAKFSPRGAIGAAVAQSPSSGWPMTLASNVAGDLRPSQEPQNLFLPIVQPATECETSKVERWNGDLQVDFTTIAAITLPHRFVTWEFLEFDESMVAALAAKAGFSGQVKRRVGGDGRVINPGQLRYTAIEFE